MPWIIPLAATAYSVYNSESSKSKAKKSERALEESLKNTPQYRPNQSILSYYNQALAKYNTNPSDTREYKLAKQDIKQNTVQGLSALRDRRSGLAGTPTLIANENQSLLRAAVNSEREKAREFDVLGRATGMKSGEEGKAFQQNEVYPFEAKYNLLGMKAAGQRADQRQSMSNAYNNLSAAASLYDGGGAYGSEYNQQNKFGNRYGYQGSGAYNWAKANNMNFGQYKRQGNRVGNALSYGVGY
jgi:hypothetical protein